MEGDAIGLTADNVAASVSAPVTLGVTNPATAQAVGVYINTAADV